MSGLNGNMGWDDVSIIRKRPANMKTAKSDAVVNAARRTGGVIDISRKATGGTNKSVHTGPVKSAFKLDNETENFQLDKVKPEVGRVIQQQRQVLNLSQKDLATKINELSKVIAEYESGKAVNPNAAILAKMEKVLGVKLRGNGIGQALAPRGSK